MGKLKIRFSLLTYVVLVLCVGSSVMLIRMWSPITRLAVLRKHFGMTCGAFSRDGHTLATASSGVCLWDISTGEERSHLITRDTRTNFIGFSLNSKYMITCAGTMARAYSVSNWQLHTVLNGHTNEVTCACYSKDSLHIATSSTDFTVRVWNVQTGKQEYEVRHPAPINTVEFLSSGKIMTACADGLIRIWDNTLSTIESSIDTHSEILTASLSTDEEYVLVGNSNSRAQAFSLTSKTLICSLQSTTNYVLAAEFSPDGKYILTGGDDFKATLWEFPSGKQLMFLALPHHVLDIAFSPTNSSKFFTCGSDYVQLWEIERDPSVGGIVNVPIFWITSLMYCLLIYCVARDRFLLKRRVV